MGRNRANGDNNYPGNKANSREWHNRKRRDLVIQKFLPITENDKDADATPEDSRQK